MEIRPLFIVVLDISGYTRFTRLHRASVLHAEKIIADLLEAMSQTVKVPLVLNKTEGDALLLYGEAGDDWDATGREILRQILDCFEVFIAELRSLVYSNACVCDACRQSNNLRLKAIVHFADTVVRSSNGRTEIGGEGAIIAHRLMKNSMTYDEYILMSSAAHEHCGPVANFREVKGRERYDELGSFETVAYVPPKTKATKPSGIWLLAKLRGLRYVAALDVYLFKRMILRRTTPGIFRNLPK